MMRRFHVRQDAKAAKLSVPERQALRTGIGLLVAAIVAMFATEDVGGLARFLASAGLVVLLLCATMRAVARYRAGATASLPAAVGRVTVRIRPARGFGAAAVLLALMLPLAALVAVLAIVHWAWLLVWAVVLMGCGALFVSWADAAAAAEHGYWMSDPAGSALLERLCIRADIPVPELVVEHDVVANAWTAGGRIHVTSELLDRLDQHELEAVLAHELAHLGRRDAAVMEICSAPSGMLLGFAGLLAPRIFRWTKDIVLSGAPPSIAVLMWILAVLCVPPAFVIGWTARLSVLGMSRARELAADAAAVTLTGRPSALASALMKLEEEGEWAPHTDLRQSGAHAVLCIVGTGRSRLGRFFSTHPPTALRVKRLARIETRIQAGPYG
jgi:heat shock protein HtpX